MDPLSESLLTAHGDIVGIRVDVGRSASASRELQYELLEHLAALLKAAEFIK